MHEEKKKFVNAIKEKKVEIKQNDLEFKDKLKEVKERTEHCKDLVPKSIRDK